MTLNHFHPAVEKWFKGVFDGPTGIQTEAWPHIKKRENVLISAPTGSGKTLAAFLSAIDDLVKQSLEGNLPDKTRIVYVSPLKALSNDIENNLRAPLKGIKEGLKEAGLPEADIRVQVRTGDTPSSVRTRMTKTPPHILVTTPESLYLLLTSKNGREMLSETDTLIVDEIHALVGSKRGSHFALSAERLKELSSKEIALIGLSATQKPIGKIARFLTGTGDREDQGCEIINTGHRRKLDLSVEVPRSPLTAVMSNEVWGEVYERLEELIKQHKTTLIFVNTRRLAERMTHNLTERLGNEVLAAHHGSISKEMRLDAEKRLKSGELRAIVATASLELGIDIGSVDLVCQIGSSKSIATFLQRVGRSGHTVKGTPKGKIFPLSLDELTECAALLHSVKRGELDSIIMPEKPLDVLAQQIVAEVSCGEYGEDELYRLFKRSYPYRDLERKEYGDVVTMLVRGFAAQKGRRGAYIHHDVVNGRLRARKGARLAALISGGTIPDSFDYDVVLEPTNTFIGTVNEDFAIESVPGDIFLLGNHSWKILKVNSGKVRVEDAGTQPPTIPFWFGEAPGRTVEFSEAVSRLREGISERLGDLKDLKRAEDLADSSPEDTWKKEALKWLTGEVGLSIDAADQLTVYMASVKAALGAMPTHKKLIMERFFDEAGAMHLVIHSPYGSRLNRAWGLSLRKRFCKKFNFELQAAATEDSIILSLGATHSFPLEEVYHYLHPSNVRHVLTQALLDAPMFEVRWRWNASTALAVLRRWTEKKVPPAVQRIHSEDLIAQVFPDQIACFENIAGEREIPDHPLVNQTIHDCLTEAMDIENLESLLGDIHSGKIELKACDLREPSPLSQQILNARPYAFLDDAPLEERRTHAVQNRRWLDPSEAAELGQLDQGAIDMVRDEAWPEAESPDELHDALVLCGFLTEEEVVSNKWQHYFRELAAQGRAAVLITECEKKLWVAVERMSEMKVLHPDSLFEPGIEIPKRLLHKSQVDEKPLVEIIRSRLEALGPVTAADLCESLGLPLPDIDQALLLLEGEGFVFRGHFTPGIEELEWCERRLLARIHKYTLHKLRKEIQPVSASDYMRFLFSWHGVGAEEKPEGVEALRRALEQLEGFEAPAAAWEGDILSSRLKDYDHSWLDTLCLSGSVVWGRFKPASGKRAIKNRKPSPIKTTPIAIVNRGNVEIWKQIGRPDVVETEALSHRAVEVLRLIKDRGASFFEEIKEGSGGLRSETEGALAELTAKGLITSDSYTGLRALLVRPKYRTERGRRRKRVSFNMEGAGRWSLLRPEMGNEGDKISSEEMRKLAVVYLRRYGVVFRKVLERESFAPPWRGLVRALRVLELRGEVRGGRFVEGVTGEQYALPEAVAGLRENRRKQKTGSLISIIASDPLNLTGIVTPGKRIAAHYKNRVLYKDGVPAAVKEGSEVTLLSKFNKNEEWSIKSTLVKRTFSPKLRAYLGKGAA